MTLFLFEDHNNSDGMSMVKFKRLIGSSLKPRNLANLPEVSDMKIFFYFLNTNFCFCPNNESLRSSTVVCDRDKIGLKISKCVLQEMNLDSSSALFGKNFI